MTRRTEPMWALLLAAACATLVGCSDDEAGPSPSGGGTGDEEGFPTDDFCPDPEHPRVHYRSQDPNDCFDVELGCTTDQNGFFNSCGCGCIDKGDPLCPPLTEPTIDWISTDPADCEPEPPTCDLGQYGFSNSCGCGCMSPGEA